MCIPSWNYVPPAFESHATTAAQSDRRNLYRHPQKQVPSVGDTYPSQCDPIDPTECILPFPSSYYLRQDSTTASGYRVNLSEDTIFPLKGARHRFNPRFLNDLDGFSTSAPILCYIDGLKEGVEVVAANSAVSSGNNKDPQIYHTSSRLPGPDDIPTSITSSSITLLIDVYSQELVPHFSEIDYLDPIRPLLVIQPAQLFKHNTTYAVVVLNAQDRKGEYLPMSSGLKELLELDVSTPIMDDPMNNKGGREKHIYKRAKYFQQTLVPTLESVAPWYNSSHDSIEHENSKESSLQLLFDFHTASAQSQLGTIRSIRDETLNRISTSDWDEQNVNVIKIEDFACDDSDTTSNHGNYIARTIHAELSVPWYLNGYGSGHRHAVIDMNALLQRDEKKFKNGKAKFLVNVPCSVKQGIKPIQAIMDYGHGLFLSRKEANDEFLVKMAHENGYLIIAMDWRGMSKYDKPVIVKALMAQPTLIEAMRDNLIQGYSNKLALQHFAKNGLLAMPWMQFGSLSSNAAQSPNSGTAAEPSMIFYGISQGGILGSGYVALLGETKLIDRAILGVPGTPFALIMSRSSDFVMYNKLMLFNYYTNRHVRVFLSMLQMAYDSVGASGHLATPIAQHSKTNDSIPRVLLQAGLGDTQVNSLAAELLSRAYGASVLPGNPRKDVFGLSVEQPANSTYDGPRSALTEILYQDEMASLPKTNIAPKRTNGVHLCVRLDSNLERQVVEFINKGKIIDPCANGACIKSRARC